MKILMLLLTLVMAGDVLASGTSAPTADSQAFQSVKTMKCVIVAVKDPNLVMLEDPDSGEKTPARLAPRINLRAKDKSLFEGRKKLEFTDLAPGQTVKVSIDTSTGEIIRLKVLARGDDGSES